jgi:hypothetical protein
MARTSKEEFVLRIAKSLDLPVAVVEKLVVRRDEGDEKDGGWKIARMPSVADLQPYGLEGRLTAAGWRTILRSIVED